VEELLKALLRNGPGFLMAGVLLWLFLAQRKDYKELVDQQKEASRELNSLVRETVTSDNEHRSTIEQMRDAQKSVDSRLEDLTREIREMRNSQGAG
jgi:hypothetical protein